MRVIDSNVCFVLPDDDWAIFSDVLRFGFLFVYMSTHADLRAVVSAVQA